MPIWATLILLKLHHQPFHFNDFVRHGEFALYTATFFAPALQVVVRNIRNSKYALGTGAVLFAVVGLVFSGIIYAGVAGAAMPQQLVVPISQNLIPSSQTPPVSSISTTTAQPLDERFLLVFSVVLFASSLCFAVFVTLIDDQPATGDVRKAEEESGKDLDDKFAGKEPVGTVGVSELQSEDEKPTEQQLAANFKPPSDAGGETPAGGSENG
jgi:hypothetical protein